MSISSQFVLQLFLSSEFSPTKYVCSIQTTPRPQPGRFSHLVPQLLIRSCVSREPEKQYMDKKQKYRTAAAPQPEMLLKAEPPLVQSPHHHSILFHLHSALKTNLFSLIIYHYSIYMHYALKVFGKNWPEKAWKFLCASDLSKKILHSRKLLFAYRW